MKYMLRMLLPKHRLVFYRQEQAEAATAEAREELCDAQREIAHYEQEIKLHKNLEEKYHAQHLMIADLQQQLQEMVCEPVHVKRLPMVDREQDVGDARSLVITS